jgi:hypothetical protein
MYWKENTITINAPRDQIHGCSVAQHHLDLSIALALKRRLEGAAAVAIPGWRSLVVVKEFALNTGALRWSTL